VTVGGVDIRDQPGLLAGERGYQPLAVLDLVEQIVRIVRRAAGVYHIPQRGTQRITAVREQRGIGIADALEVSGDRIIAESEEPLAWALASLMRNGLGRVRRKLRCLKRIAAARLNDVQRFLLVDCVQTYILLDEREAVEYSRVLREEKEGPCPSLRAPSTTRVGKPLSWRYVVEEPLSECAKRWPTPKVEEVSAMEMTWSEGLIARGEATGQLEGARRMLKRQLTESFGPLSDDVVRRIAALDSEEELERLAVQVIRASSLEELELERGC